MKFKTIFFPVLLLIAFAGGSKAQVVVTLFPSPADQFFIDDLWKTTIVNPLTAPVTGYLQITITTGNQVPVLTATVSSIVLHQGSNNLNSNAKWLNRMQYATNNIGGQLQSMGTLPYGQYIFCATFYSATNSKDLGIDCEEREIKPLNPPVLASPSNGEQISTTIPLLTWLPPTPLSNLIIDYSLKLVQVIGNESAQQALISNAPLLNENNITVLTLNYPAEAPLLEVGNTYAWQISASYQGYNLGTTEVWKFTIINQTSTTQVKNNQSPNSYPKIKKESSGSFYIAPGYLRFMYQNTANDSSLHYVIYNSANKKIVPLNIPVKLNYGVNQISLNLANSGSFKNGDYYLLEIMDSNNQRYKMSFVYQTNP